MKNPIILTVISVLIVLLSYFLYTNNVNDGGAEQVIQSEYSQVRIENDLARLYEIQREIKVVFEPEAPHEYVLSLVSELDELSYISEITYISKKESADKFILNSDQTLTDEDIVAIQRVTEPVIEIVLVDVLHVDKTLEYIEILDADKHIAFTESRKDSVSRLVDTLEEMQLQQSE